MLLACWHYKLSDVEFISTEREKRGTRRDSGICLLENYECPPGFMSILVFTQGQRLLRCVINTFGRQNISAYEESPTGGEEEEFIRVFCLGDDMIYDKFNTVDRCSQESPSMSSPSSPSSKKLSRTTVGL